MLFVVSALLSIVLFSLPSSRLRGVFTDIDIHATPSGNLVVLPATSHLRMAVDDDENGIELTCLRNHNDTFDSSGSAASQSSSDIEVLPARKNQIPQELRPMALAFILQRAMLSLANIGDMSDVLTVVCRTQNEQLLPHWHVDKGLMALFSCSSECKIHDLAQSRFIGLVTAAGFFPCFERAQIGDDKPYNYAFMAKALPLWLDFFSGPEHKMYLPEEAGLSHKHLIEYGLAVQGLKTPFPFNTLACQEKLTAINTAVAEKPTVLIKSAKRDKNLLEQWQRWRKEEPEILNEIGSSIACDPHEASYAVAQAGWGLGVIDSLVDFFMNKML